MIKTKNKTEKQLIDTNTALPLVKEICDLTITRKTLLIWLKKNNLGRKIGGRWLVYRDKFTSYLNGESKK